MSKPLPTWVADHLSHDWYVAHTSAAATPGDYANDVCDCGRVHCTHPEH